MAGCHCATSLTPPHSRPVLCLDETILIYLLLGLWGFMINVSFHTQLHRLSVVASGLDSIANDTSTSSSSSRLEASQVKLSNIDSARSHPSLRSAASWKNNRTTSTISMTLLRLILAGTPHQQMQTLTSANSRTMPATWRVLTIIAPIKDKRRYPLPILAFCILVSLGPFPASSGNIYSSICLSSP